MPYFARYFRTLTFDPPGNGRSDRPATGYDHDRMADHTRAVLDAAGVERASLVCLSRGTWPGAILAAQHPARVDRLVLTATTVDDEVQIPPGFLEPRDHYEGWNKYNAHYWRAHYREFLEFFMAQTFTEPHSSKAREDGLAWALGTTPEVLIATAREWSCRSSAADLLARIHAPTLIIHGTKDAVRPFRLAERAHAAIAGSVLMPFEGSGHCPQVRDPVRYNLAVRDFLDPPAPARRPWRRAMTRPRRALIVSSPIGSAIRCATWRSPASCACSSPTSRSSGSPRTRSRGSWRRERDGPSREPAPGGESAHIESEAGEHDLHVFQPGGTWTRSCSPTSWCCTTCWRPSPTTS